MLHKAFRGALACASVLALAASAPASAQQVNRIVVFGDSYADQGNLFALGYNNPLAKVVYPTGRFSGGTNYIDTLHLLLGAPVYNYAIGGAEGGVNNNVVCFSDPTFGGVACGKGLQYEVDQFLNGPNNGVYPTTSTTFTRSDLLAISIGGNDARFYQEAGGTLAAAPATGAAAAAVTSTTLTQLIGNGTPTISVLAGDTGKLPEIANNPAGAAIRTAYSDSFNSTMRTTLAGYAAKGSIVHYLDLIAVLNDVTANPAGYGITKGIACPLFDNFDFTCLESTDGYLVYGDGLHLTSGGFAIVARYVQAQLAAPLTLQAPSELGVSTAKQWGRILSSRSDLYRDKGAAGLRFFATGDYFQRDVGDSLSNDAFDIRGAGVTAGAEFGMPMATLGIAANYTRPKADFRTNTARVKGHSWQIGAYGNVDLAGIFAQGYLGYGKDRNRITRTGVVEDMTARPHGDHVTAGLKAGYLMPLPAVKLGPVVALDYARAKVDGYTEAGDPALTLTVSRQTFKSTTGRVGLEARADLAQLHAFAEASVEHEFSGDGRLITFAQTTAPTIVNHWDVYGDKQTYGRLSLGAAAQLTPGISVDLSGSTTIGRNHGNDSGAQVGLKAAF